MRKLVATPGRRVTLVAVLMAIAWGAMIVCQGLRSPVQQADWSLMSEVGRRVALGDTLYVDAMDQKGPLCYATYALAWLVAHTPFATYVLCNVAVWALLTTSSVLAALLLEEERNPRCHPLAQALLAGVLIVPHVGCLELWFMPLGLLCALWVKRLTRGERVSTWCWVVVGLSCAYTFWCKFTCCAQFVFLLCYGASRKSCKGLGRAVGIALLACAVGSLAVVLWVWLAGSFDGMVRHYLFAASDGYAARMSMLRYLETQSSPSTIHVTSFFLGLALAIWALIRITISTPRRRWLVVLGILALMASCFATFVGYYRFQLAVLVVVAAADVPQSAPALRFVGWVEHKLHDRVPLLPLAGTIAVAVAMAFTCMGTSDAMARTERLRNALHEAVGTSASVLAWDFGHTWIYADLGIEFYYPIPARYNASQDLWEQTASADVAAHRWEYVVTSVSNTAKVGHVVTLGNTQLRIIAVQDEMAVASGKPLVDPIQSGPYRLP